jgi:hypothetical protein
MKVEGEKRYGLLLATKDSDYVKKVYGGYFNVYLAAFGEEGERWELFRVIDGEFPDVNELQNYDGFVVSGSPSDAYGNDYWILKLCLLLQTLDAMEKKILGICFGHQVIIKLQGGPILVIWTINILSHINFMQCPSKSMICQIHAQILNWSNWTLSF